MEHCPYAAHTYPALQPCFLDTNAFGPSQTPPSLLQPLPNNSYSGQCQARDLHPWDSTMTSYSDQRFTQRLYRPPRAHTIPSPSPMVTVRSRSGSCGQGQSWSLLQPSLDQHQFGPHSSRPRVSSQRSLTDPSCAVMRTQSSLSYMDSQGQENQTGLPTRINKSLPPPTLSPILVSSIPTPAPRRPTLSTQSSSTSISSLSRSWSSEDTWSSRSSHSNSGVDSDDDEKTTTRARTISDRPWTEPLADQKILSWQRAQLPTWDQPWVDDSRVESGEDGEGSFSFSLSLSESIWGPGWRQVEPMPPSFVKTLEQTEMEAQAQALLLQQQAQTTNPKTKAKRARQAAAAAAAAAAANKDTSSEESAALSVSSASTAATDSGVPSVSHNSLNAARLPRSLQFVEEAN